MADFLVFQLSGHSYAVDSASVREVVRAVRIVPLPKAPPIVEGVIDYRGTIAAVLDIRGRFGHAHVPLTPHQHFVVADAHRLVALRVDRVAQVITPGVHEIDAIDDTPYVAGAVKLPDGLVLIHDLATFLSTDEADALDEALQGADA